MHLQITNRRYKGSNCELSIDRDGALSATSYDWWRFVWSDSVGNIIINNSRYSISTSKHQSAVWSILRRLNRPVCLELNYVRSSHRFANSAIEDEIKAIGGLIRKLESEISAKGSHRRKNEERREQIKHFEFRIKDLQRYLDEYLNKKYFRDCWRDGQYWKYDDDSRDELIEVLRRLFLNHKGKFDEQALHHFIADNLVPITNNLSDRVACEYSKLLALLDLKPIDRRKIVIYEFALDLENQLPEIDSDEFLKIKKFCDKNSIGKNFTNFDLEILHTKLTNLQNRKTYEPKPEEFWPINPILDLVLTDLRGLHDLESRHLNSARLLRAEGKRQKHCIGGSNYIEQVGSGRYFATHIAGGTYLFDQDLNITQASASCNRPVNEYHETLIVNLIEVYKRKIVRLERRA